MIYYLVFGNMLKIEGKGGSKIFKCRCIQRGELF